MAETICDEMIWIEIGPHAVCTGFIKSSIPSIKLAVPSFRRDDSNWKTLAHSMASLHPLWAGIDWNEFHRPMEKRLRLLDLPTYAFSEKNHWLQYNGDWCLTKGNNFYTKGEESARDTDRAQSINAFRTSSVQRIIAEDINGLTGSVTMQSDLMRSDLHDAASGHRMNNCSVVTSVSFSSSHLHQRNKEAKKSSSLII
jgi:acyl transferase domain-containing protein